MKSAKPLPADAPAHRRSQPVRQTRTNPARSAANASRPGGGRDGQASDQAIDIFPAITHFSDTITALPKELVRHFTLLKEVDAKLFAPEEQLFKLVAEAAATPLPYPPANVEAEAASAAARTSASTAVQKHSSASSAHQASTDEATATASFVFDHANVPRRQLFRQTALKIQEMLVSLEEKNHVLSTANEALQRQLARVEDVWPHLENEFSAEAKWGSTTHWAYPENRNSKASHAERARRDGAAAISAAAQALADEAAARSDARKQAVQAKRNQKNQHLDSDADDLAGRNKGEGKKTQKARRTAEGNVGLGISGGASTNGNPPPKRRKVERTTNGGEPMERVMSNVLANSAPKVKTSSPRGTPAPDGPRKRKALPSGSGQSKKKNGMSPSITSSPVMGPLPEPRITTRGSPAPGGAPRPTSARARRNSLQSNADNGRARAVSSASSKPNGTAAAAAAVTTSEPSSATPFPPPAHETSAPKASSAKPEPIKSEGGGGELEGEPASTPGVDDAGGGDGAEQSESAPPPPPLISLLGTVMTKSGRASKPSTPAILAAQEAARPRSVRNTDNGGGGKKRKINSATQALAPPGDEASRGPTQGDDDDGDGDGDEPTYCYCNSVSYGEMVACDADRCQREWFHLACVGLKVAPGSKTKWYCEDCKKHLKMGDKKVSSR